MRLVKREVRRITTLAGRQSNHGDGNNESVNTQASCAGATAWPRPTPLVQAGVLVINSISGEAVTINYNGANQGTIAGAFSDV